MNNGSSSDCSLKGSVEPAAADDGALGVEGKGTFVRWLPGAAFKMTGFSCSAAGEEVEADDGKDFKDLFTASRGEEEVDD